MRVSKPTALSSLLVLATGLLSFTVGAQSFQKCGGDVHSLQLDTRQLAFAHRTIQDRPLTWRCAEFQGYGRGCSGNNSVYTFISLESNIPPYQPNLTVRPYVLARAFPNQYNLQAANYYLDMLTGTIYVRAAGPPGVVAPYYSRYNATLDSYGYPDANGNVLDGSGNNQSSLYAFYLNDIRSAIQNVTSPPYGEPDFACNGQLWNNTGLDDVLQWLYVVQGIAGDQSLPLGPPLDTGYLPPNAILQ